MCCENLKTSESMIAVIKKFEGLRLKAYKCPAGVQTIGYGHTRNFKFSENYKITEEQAEKFLHEDLKKFENSIKKLVKVPLSQCQFDALVSFTFNVGATNLKNSTLLKYLNNGEYSLAAEQFERWIYSNGKKLEGLLTRRKAEKEIFLHVCCASIISTVLFLLGGVDIPLIWLFIFVVIDYLSGSWYAIKSGNWSSSVGGKGILKKIIIFLMVVIANGIDQSTGINYIRQAVIIAYLINESGSILENIENLGYGSIIPSVLRNGLKAINQKNSNLSEVKK